MFQNSLLTTLAGIGLRASFSFDAEKVMGFRTATSPRSRRRTVRNRFSDVPRWYSGAKLARKAMNGTVGKATLR